MTHLLFEKKENGALAIINFYLKSSQRKRKLFAVATKPKPIRGEWAMMCAADQQNSRHEKKNLEKTDFGDENKTETKNVWQTNLLE